MTYDLPAIVAELQADLASTFAAMDWAEDEIARAARRHPGTADTLFHSFRLLTPQDRMGVEFVYRGHARELLERVATGQDTRPGTAAEVCLAIVAAGKVAPVNVTAFGLLTRMWAQAFPGHPIDAAQAALNPHYEAVRGQAITDLEAETRTRLTAPERHLPAITCRGMHHGEQVACRYAAQPAPVLTLPAGEQLPLDLAEVA